MKKQSFIHSFLKSSASSLIVCCVLFAALFSEPSSNPLYAGPTTAVVKELTEFLYRKVGGTVSKEVAEQMTIGVEKIVARYGDEGISALRKVGPSAIGVIESAGEAAPACVKLMARHGDEAIWIVAKPKRLAIFVKYGDDAANAMLRHTELAEPMIERFGANAASALAQVTSQNGRRLAMLNNNGLFQAVEGQSPRLFDVIKEHGDVAADFIWKNKGALTVSATLTAFLLNPQPFISGASQLSEVAFEQVAAPLANAAANNMPWKIIGISGMALLIVYVVGIHNLFAGLLFVPRWFRGKLISGDHRGHAKANIAKTVGRND